MKHKTIVIIVFALATLGVLWHGSQPDARPVTDGNWTEIVKGDFKVVHPYEGKLQSRNLLAIMSRFRGVATAVDLVDEGQQVKPGDLLVRFDTSELDSQVVKLESELTLARTDLEHLQLGKHPLQLDELNATLADIQRELKIVDKNLEDSRLLLRDKLIPKSEVAELELKSTRLNSRRMLITRKIILTTDYIHPAEIVGARSKLQAAEQAYQLTRHQIDNSTIVATSAGLVVYKPLHIDSDFRKIRVGDGIYPNQPFMVIPDLTDLVVQVSVPESELSRIQAQAEVNLQMLAFPDITLAGRVEKIGAVARNIPGMPEWQMYFNVTIGIKSDLTNRAHDLRPGMSVVASVVTHFQPDALLIQRRAVTFNNDIAHAEFITGDGTETRQLTLGYGNERYFEVLKGASYSERVLLP